MHEQHQISRLPAERQGEVCYETTTKSRHLVPADSVSHTTDIHLAHPVNALRSPCEGWRKGGRCVSSLRIQR